MLYTYNDCIEKFSNDYQINKALNEKKIYKLAAGIYSDCLSVSDLEITVFKYPNAVFTMNSAFYYHSLTDEIPEKYYLATTKDAAKINSPKIKQFFHRNDKFYIGITTMIWQKTPVKIYDSERMLIELIRNKKALPFDLYKEVIGNYRKRTDSIDTEKLQNYIACFPNPDNLFNTIQLEVY